MASRSENYKFSAFAAVYVGSAAPVGQTQPSDDLLRIGDGRTDGCGLAWGVDTKFLDVLGNDVQEGRQQIRFNLAFFGAGAKPMRMMMGNPLDVAREDSPSQFALYSVFLQDPNPDSDDSFWIPVCKTKKAMRHDRIKKQALNSPVLFDYEWRDLNVNLYYKDTFRNLLDRIRDAGRDIG